MLFIYYFKRFYMVTLPSKFKEAWEREFSIFFQEHFFFFAGTMRFLKFTKFYLYFVVWWLCNLLPHFWSIWCLHFALRDNGYTGLLFSMSGRRRNATLIENTTEMTLWEMDEKIIFLLPTKGMTMATLKDGLSSLQNSTVSTLMPDSSR